MRLAAAVGVVVLALPTLTVAQTTERHSACIAGDGGWIRKVCFTESDDPARYGHSVLGETPEWTAITVFNGPEARLAADGNRRANTIIGPPDHIFEDIAPRLADLDGDGRPEVITVQSSFDKGARLVVYAVTPEPRQLAATPYIGQPLRWLAPAGVGDFDGDGRPEIAYVDRPHLARELVFVRLQGNRLVEIARLPGLSNHRIGERTITAAVRTCPGGTEVVLPDAAWTRLVAARLDGARIVTRDAGPYRGKASLARAAAC
ncbi:MAG: FG-GAP repeat domain-containing protein [Gemmobacter sp.]